MNLPPLMIPALALLASAAQAAAAAEPDWGEARSIAVRAEDLRLADPAGAARLHARIEAAIARVCDLPNAHQLAQRARVLACVTATREQARGEADRLIAVANRVARSH